jgi:GGDEF domain-containing protein
MRFGEEEFASVGISVGSASYPKDGEALNDLIVVADKAMYRAKAVNKLHRDITPADIVAAAVFDAEPITNEELEELIMSSASN